LRFFEAAFPAAGFLSATSAASNSPSWGAFEALLEAVFAAPRPFEGAARFDPATLRATARFAIRPIDSLLLENRRGF
jgi:hypothetical protein